MSPQVEVDRAVRQRATALRRQIAVVRALLDDLTRVSSPLDADRTAPAITTQFGEELSRLGRHALDVAGQLEIFDRGLKRCAAPESQEEIDASQAAISGVFLSRRTG